MDGDPGRVSRDHARIRRFARRHDSAELCILMVLCTRIWVVPEGLLEGLVAQERTD
jgi:hypothetical protein